MTTEVVGVRGAAIAVQGPRSQVRRRGAGMRSGWDGGQRAQAMAVTSLVCVALLVYGLPAVVGHPVVPGDDLTQNLPLRELVGSDLRAGTLPVFDPYIWSGAPLLAGWNAGAAYPLTWLFAVLPGAAAWTVNLLAASVAAAIGSYAFLRASRLGVLASWTGGLTFAFGGGMVAQVSHVGLVIGMSWVPVALLAIRHLTQEEPAHVRTTSAWTAALAASVGLMLLSGEPRAVTDGAAVLVVYAAWRVLRRFGSSARQGAVAAAATCGGLVLGIGLGAVQLLPGLAAVATSQRAHATAFLFGAGSLPVRWLALLGVPDLLGGSGSFGAPTFFARYNLTEVTGYVGILPLVAALALFAQLGRARRARRLPEWIIWEVIAAVGLVLALGNHTPLWHALFHIPLMGGQRLQSRGILVSDLALAVLLAYWVDSWGRAETTSRSAERTERLLGAVPALCVLGVVVSAWLLGSSFFGWLGAHVTAAQVRGLDPWLVPSFALALVALGLLVAKRRLTPSQRGRAVGAFVVVDLLLFSLTSVVAVGVPAAGSVVARVTHGGGGGSAAVSPATRLRPLASLRLTGRFAVYDPGLLDGPELRSLGVPDMNALAGTWSVQGYGSITDEHYAAATGVHGVSGTGQDVFAPRAAIDGALDALDTRAVLSPSEYLRRSARAATSPGARGPGVRRVGAGGRATWFVGTPLVISSVTVRTGTGHAPTTNGLPGASPVKVGLLAATGKVRWGLVRRADSSDWLARWAHPSASVGVVVVAPAAAVISPPLVTDRGGRAYELSGPLQQAMVAPHWRYGGQDGPFAVFVDRHARAPLSLRAPPGRSLRGAAVRAIAGPRLEPSSAVVSSPHGVDVVRAVAEVPGWTASWAPSEIEEENGGAETTAPRTLIVRRLGPVQLVRVPAGRGILSWHYRAPGLSAGELLSTASVALVAAVVIGPLLADRRRRSRPT